MTQGVTVFNMVDNYICENCDKVAVCKIVDVLDKFQDYAKKPLGVNITIESCANFSADDEQ